MSIRIIKQGILDIVQDAGRYGYQHLGINPGGVADRLAFSVANMLVGNKEDEAVIELHYPASSILFEEDAMIALSGADFNACINSEAIPINTPVLVGKGSVLEFIRPIHGCRCYLSVKGGFQTGEWLGSYSTNTKAQAGGYKGRGLIAGDTLLFKNDFSFPKTIAGKSFLALGWRADVAPLYLQQPVIRICRGNEYDQLTEASRELLINTAFTITHENDRMGCRLLGISLQKKAETELVSSAVTRGTIQLLPGGQLIILTADHQTTGGYPRIAHVVSADMPTLAQQQPGGTLGFKWIDIAEAETLLIRQHRYLLQLQIACNLRLEEFFSAHALY